MMRHVNPHHLMSNIISYMVGQIQNEINHVNPRIAVEVLSANKLKA